MTKKLSDNALLAIVQRALAHVAQGNTTGAQEELSRVPADQRRHVMRSLKGAIEDKKARQ